MRAASLVGLLLFLGSSMSSGAEPAPLIRLWTGGQNLSNPTNSRLRIGAEVVPQAIAEGMTRFVRQEAKRFAEEHQ